MRTGVFKSNGGKYYLLDTVRGTGTYGKLLKNGSVYNGITLKCDTSAEYEGALSEDTLAALGVDLTSVPNVENTKHVENGSVVVTTGTETQNTNTQNNQSNTTNASNQSDWDIINQMLSGGNTTSKEGDTGFAGDTTGLPDMH